MTINYAIKPNVKPWNPQAILTTSNQVADTLYGIYQEEYKKNILEGQLAFRTVYGNFIVAGNISVQNKEKEELILISGTDKAIYVGNTIVLDGINGFFSLKNLSGSEIIRLDSNGFTLKSGTGTAIITMTTSGFSLKNSVGTEIIKLDATGITVKKTGGIIVTDTNSIELQQGGDLELYISPTFNPAAIVYYGVNQSKLAEVYVRAGAGVTEGIIFDPQQANRELYLGKVGDLWGQISLHATNLYLRGGFEIGDINDALRHNQTIQVLSGSSGSFYLAHNGSSKPDYCYVNCCGGLNNHLVNTTWDFDSSDATNVLVEWATIDGSSYSSQSIRFHATFIWT